MGLREYFAMHRRWSDHPPVPLMVAAYLGIKPQVKFADNDEAMEALLAMFGVSGGGTAVIGSL